MAMKGLTPIPDSKEVLSLSPRSMKGLVSGMSIREKLQDQLGDYIFHTLQYTQTIQEFCDGEPKWTLQRESELDMMRDIIDRASQITLKLKHVTKAENKTKALGEYVWSGLTQFTAVSRKQELQKELGEVLKNTLEGLEKLQHFLDAVEKLAVTSLFVFMGDGFMPKGVSSMSVHSVISAARIVSPLLIHFKRDAGSFFLPSLSNVEVLAYQLDKYIRITQQICEKMEKNFRRPLVYGGDYEWKRTKCSWGLDVDVSEESGQKVHDHLLHLTEIRMDELFRLTFLFDVKAEEFIDIFCECHGRMFQFLLDLEKYSVRMHKMKKGSNISTIAGSSVGIAGGVLSIMGLALAPVTAGSSLALTATGVGLGVTSGINSLVTGVTEMAVNNHHRKNANSTFIRFMDDVQKILECMEDVASREGCLAAPSGVTTAVGVGKLAFRVRAVGKGVDALVDAASAMKALRSEEVVAKTVNMGLQEATAGRNIPKLASDLPDIGQLAKGTPLALSNSARVGFIGLNALFIGVDIFFICHSGISLKKGSKNNLAELIHSRSALWRSEVEAWEKIYHHLFEGISRFHKKLEFLEQPIEF